MGQTDIKYCEGAITDRTRQTKQLNIFPTAHHFNESHVFEINDSSIVMLFYDVFYLIKKRCV